ncbi:MAG: hypothetical protein WCX70_02795 [Candidatus Paceibacterota bacterium]|jgi:hypothetical protein
MVSDQINKDKVETPNYQRLVNLLVDYETRFLHSQEMEKTVEEEGEKRTKRIFEEITKEANRMRELAEIKRRFMARHGAKKLKQAQAEAYKIAIKISIETKQPPYIPKEIEPSREFKKWLLAKEIFTNHQPLIRRRRRKGRQILRPYYGRKAVGCR